MTRSPNHTQEARALATRARILKAAVRLFARHGYHKTTISDLCQAIGLTSGAIYHHFPSKDALLEALIDWLARGMRIYTQYLGPDRGGSFHTVRDVMGVMCDHFRRSPEATICLAALATEFAGSSHPLEQRIREVYELFVESFSAHLANHPRVRDPRAAAIAFVGAVQGIAVQGLLREGEWTIDALAEGFLGMLAEW